MANARLLPLHFGPAEGPLFGCHHGPEAPIAAAPGVVIAPPLGHEYSRAHRALAKLGDLVAARGLRALRFDFRGTGDSALDTWPTDLGPWIEDLEFARRELVLRARVPATALVGVRLSAALALECAAARRSTTAPAALVLWDPVLDGARFVRDLVEQERRFRETLPSGGARRAAPAGGGAGPGGAGIECLGFLWPAELVARLESWRAPAPEQALAARILILETRLTPEAEAFARDQSGRGARVEHAASSGAEPWREDVDRGLVPAVDLQRIADFLRGGP